MTSGAGFSTIRRGKALAMAAAVIGVAGAVGAWRAAAAAPGPARARARDAGGVRRSIRAAVGRERAARAGGDGGSRARRGDAGVRGQAGVVACGACQRRRLGIDRACLARRHSGGLRRRRALRRRHAFHAPRFRSRVAVVAGGSTGAGGRRQPDGPPRVSPGNLRRAPLHLSRGVPGAGQGSVFVALAAHGQRRLLRARRRRALRPPRAFARRGPRTSPPPCARA